jgi:hypothetical protein
MATLILSRPSAGFDPLPLPSGDLGLDTQSLEGQWVREATQKARSFWNSIVGTPTTVARTHGPEHLEARFRALAQKWRDETSHLSSAARMAQHPAYQEIIGMGFAAVPLLLAQLQSKPDFWFAALRAITGENPVPPRCAGKLKEMARAWVRWGRAKGHIT